MTGDTPGLQIFSDEWIATVAPEIPLPHRGVIREICQGFQLGDSYAPSLLYGMILPLLGGESEPQGTTEKTEAVDIHEPGEFK